MKKKFLPLLFPSLLGACNSVFYQPLQQDLYDPKKLGLQHSEERIPSDQDLTLAAWWFKSIAKESYKKLIVHFHGNAENMTSHFMFTAWLTQEGFDVLTFDYRGYGRSSAVAPTREGLIQDGCAVFRWVQQHPVLKDYELYVIGQSLGGAVAVSVLAHCPTDQVKGLVLDSTFSSYRKIARQKLGGFFVTWPLQYPLSFLVTDDWSPIDSVAQLKMRMIFFHSPHDPVVPYNLGKDLFEKATAPKVWVDVEWDGHTRAFGDPESPYREQLVKFLR
ncbi:MAG TPA: alpha/beta hydrolase [Oligoflexus sp.]|uniref:alpha/beta hydrolase n=1 Tax=Oligoflexus sp. TaxID=1971216 RepID=UPI002D36EC23|nr:alpha/beta hydrolase [Oligoflexus sp.]HYX35510.1 alpha/beta hydrolase [Oligoflexus sp.]